MQNDVSQNETILDNSSEITNKVSTRNEIDEIDSSDPISNVDNIMFETSLGDKHINNPQIPLKITSATTETSEETLARLMLPTDAENSVTTVIYGTHLNIKSQIKAARSEDEESYQKMDAKYGAWENSSGVRNRIGWGFIVIGALICC